MGRQTGKPRGKVPTAELVVVAVGGGGGDGDGGVWRGAGTTVWECGEATAGLQGDTP